MRKSYSRHINYLLDTSLQTVGDINGDDEPITFEKYAANFKKFGKPENSKVRVYRILHKSIFTNSGHTKVSIINALNENDAIIQFKEHNKTRQILTINGKLF